MSARSKGQVWQCPTCEYTYEPALPCIEVLCPGQHSKGRRSMTLIAGEPVISKTNSTEPNRTESKGKNHVASGKV